MIATIVPKGWPKPLKDVEPGHFIVPHGPDITEGSLCFKTEYGGENDPQLYNSGGEHLCTNKDTLVQPVELEWSDIDE